ncbi:hypothetical protein V8E55_006457 [Tylopilus felleus]
MYEAAKETANFKVAKGYVSRSDSRERERAKSIAVRMDLALEAVKHRSHVGRRDGLKFEFMCGGREARSLHTGRYGLAATPVLEIAFSTGTRLLDIPMETMSEATFIFQLREVRVISGHDLWSNVFLGDCHLDGRVSISFPPDFLHVRVERIGRRSISPQSSDDHARRRVQDTPRTMDRDGRQLQRSLADESLSTSVTGHDYFARQKYFDPICKVIRGYIILHLGWTVVSATTSEGIYEKQTSQGNARSNHHFEE